LFDDGDTDARSGFNQDDDESTRASDFGRPLGSVGFEDDNNTEQGFVNVVADDVVAPVTKKRRMPAKADPPPKNIKPPSKILKHLADGPASPMCPFRRFGNSSRKSSDVIFSMQNDIGVKTIFPRATIDLIQVPSVEQGIMIRFLLKTTNCTLL
jgi:hypothetical protein